MQRIMQAEEWNLNTLQQWLALTRAPIAQRRLAVEQGRNEGHVSLAEIRADEACTAVARRVWQWLEESPLHFILRFTDSHYPPLLREIYRPPLLLFGLGNPQLLLQPYLAVIGSRNAAPLSLTISETIVNELCAAGYGIVSGMALGIDGLAHKRALANNAPTVAVLGCGPDLNYPPRNRQLRLQIAEEGVVLSEYPPGTPAKTEHFPARNRIISGISKGVLVAEAKQQSGSLITARCAIEQGREVFAIPGPVLYAGSAGCHLLIQQGAKLVTCSQDILVELPAPVSLTPQVLGAQGSLQLVENEQPHSNKNGGEGATHVVQRAAAQKAAVNNRKTEEINPQLLANAEILANVGFTTTSFEWLLSQTNGTVAEVVNQLISLELDGWIKTVPGGYVRVRR